MKSFIIRTVLAGVLNLMVTSCGFDGARSISVDGHIFNVPTKHLVQGTIPWLPRSQSSGLKFVINPEDRTEEQMMVTMEPVESTCHPKTPPVYNMLAAACEAAEKRQDPGVQHRFFKKNLNGDPTQWQYHVETESNGGQNGLLVVASCSSLSDDGSSGLCTSVHNYKNLVYSVDFRDKDIQNLPHIWEKVHKMLASWEEGKGASI